MTGIAILHHLGAESLVSRMTPATGWPRVTRIFIMTQYDTFPSLGFFYFLPSVLFLVFACLSWDFISRLLSSSFFLSPIPPSKCTTVVPRLVPTSAHSLVCLLVCVWFGLRLPFSYPSPFFVLYSDSNPRTTWHHQPTNLFFVIWLSPLSCLLRGDIFTGIYLPCLLHSLTYSSYHTNRCPSLSLSSYLLKSNPILPIFSLLYLNFLSRRTGISKSY